MYFHRTPTHHLNPTYPYFEPYMGPRMAQLLSLATWTDPTTCPPWALARMSVLLAQAALLPGFCTDSAPTSPSLPIPAQMALPFPRYPASRRASSPLQPQTHTLGDK
jgi:hypothetical protein